MDIGTTFLDFLNHNGIPGAIIVFAGWFLVAKLWPFVTEKWWPDTVDRNRRQTTILAELAEAVIELKLITQQMSDLLTEQRERLSDIQVTIARTKTETIMINEKESKDVEQSKSAGTSASPNGTVMATIRADHTAPTVPIA